ncbi:MAG: DUF6335 family protein [Acidobacteriota bacterium]
MAKRNGARGARTSGSRRKNAPTARSTKRPTAKRQLSRPAAKSRKPAKPSKAGQLRKAAQVKVKPASRPSRKITKPAARTPKPAVAAATGKRPRATRARPPIDVTIPTPPSSLDMERHGSSVRTGRAVMAETLRDHAGMSADIAAGDVDVDVEDAYFTGDEAPGGDNSTPDQDIVDDIGKALGVEYQDNEPLRSTDKVSDRDKHRWELDPASSEDYRERKK